MDIIQQTQRQPEKKINKTLLALLPNKIIQTSKGPVTATGIKGQLHFGSREKRAIPVMAILQAGAAIGETLIKGINPSFTFYIYICNFYLSNGRFIESPPTVCTHQCFKSIYLCIML